MFGLGPPEIVLIAVAALLVFGPKRLPELAKGLGKGIRDFKKALEDREEEPKQSLPPSSQTQSAAAPTNAVAREKSPLTTEQAHSS